MSLNIPQGTFLGHPKGLFLLFLTEMWERFSYYGMRALLVLYLSAATDALNPGFGWTTESALKMYAWYTGLVYLTPLLGGVIADRYIGQRKSIIIGGIMMAIGQFALAAPIAGMPTIALFNWPAASLGFYFGLLMIIFGNGFFKPNISSMVGDLYEQGDSRRDGAFTIFYMGINVGAFIAPLVCSTLGENPAFGWRMGFLAAGVGMILSVIIQLIFAKKLLGDVGVQPNAVRSREMSGGTHAPLTAVERDRMRVIFLLFVFVVLFWAAFEQAGGLMNIFAERYTDRNFFSFEVPTGWFQSLNPIYIVILAPIFAWVWNKLALKGKNPATPTKMVLGLLLVALGFVFMVIALFEMKITGKANMIWLFLAYLFHTMGELCTSPVGLSMITKLAPARLASLMMGVWFLNNFAANLLAGYIGAYSETAGESLAVQHFAANFGIQPEYSGLLAIFGGLVVVLAIFGLGLWSISGKLIDWMHGAEKVTH